LQDDVNFYESNESLWQKLYEIDPIRASQINKNDIYRVKRALEIQKITGEKPSNYVPIYNPLFDFILVILTRDRNDLYKRINNRVIKMFDQGWIDEVKSLSNEWMDFLRKKKLIGYDDILLFLESHYNNNKEILIQTIQTRVRKYAKRQLTFFKTLNQKIMEAEKKNKEFKAKKITWLNLTLDDPSLYIDQLLKHINNGEI